MATNSSFYSSPSILINSTTQIPSRSTNASSNSLSLPTIKPGRRPSTYKQEDAADMKGITSEEFDVLPPVVRRKVWHKVMVISN